MKVLDYFNFGNYYRGCFYFKKVLKHVFYKMALCLSFLRLRQGCRQRDPISQYLIDLCGGF